MTQLTPEDARDMMVIRSKIFGHLTGRAEFAFYLDAIQFH